MPESEAHETKAVLELSELEARYAATRALLPTSLSLYPGQTLAVIGPSGCGKTTLLRAVLGLLPAASGSVRFCGELLTAENALALRTRMGHVVQDGALFPHLTVEQNVTLMSRHLRRPAAASAERVRALLELCRLPAEVLPRYPVQLSGGQRQRVGLMRALMLDPVLLLLDEPLAAVDPLVRAELQDDLHAVFRALGKAVLLVTHDLAEAEFFGHEIALMNEGRIVQRGSFEALVRAPAEPFVTRFVHAQRRQRAPVAVEGA